MFFLWLPIPMTYSLNSFSGLPWWLRGKETTCQFRRCGFDPWVGKIPWRRKRQPTPVFLPGISHDQRGLVGYSPWGRKDSDTTLHLNSKLNPVKVHVIQIRAKTMRREKVNSPRHLEKVRLHKIYKILFKYYLVLFLLSSHSGNTILREYVC